MSLSKMAGQSTGICHVKERNKRRVKQATRECKDWSGCRIFCCGHPRGEFLGTGVRHSIIYIGLKV